tara:strand:+ start:2608 stop:2871 length:264 start_codon:yes stop_codon:yes gene_type:complete
VSLHILNSPASLDRCRFSLNDGDAIILIENAVLLAASSLPLAHTNITTSALQDDLDRRGITPAPEINTVDYAGFVNLCAQHAHCLSW